MKHIKNFRNKQVYFRILIIPILLIAVLLFLGYSVWKQYRNTMMENQTDQLLRVSEILKNTIEIFIMEYENDLNFLKIVDQQEIVTDDFYKYYLDANNSFICNVLWQDEQGNITKSVHDFTIAKSELITRINENNSIYQYIDENSKNYLVFKNVLDTGKSLNLVLDGEQYYLKLISNIRIGTKGYILLKNSEGQIIMHPDKNQWGIDVIEGRKELYPGLDFSSLEEMIEKQKKGKTAVSEYYSYWWLDDMVPRVKKIAAYTPAAVGNDFWIVSTVTEYNDFYEPIKEGFVKIILVFFGITVILLLLSGGLGKLLLDREKSTAEIIYLKELNELLEEVHRNEEMLAHRERLQIIGTITSAIAHEINNFLTPILGYAELLMMELPESSDTYENAQEIYEASEKASDIIRQISLLSRKNVETVYKSISAEEMIKRSLKLVASVCPEQICITSDIKLEDAKILGNATQINQVILNIGINAINAIGNKKGTILVSSCEVDKRIVEKYIGVKLSDAWSDYIQIDIKDNGHGLDKDTLRQIFEPFFTTKKHGEGTGLGLALVEQIIHSHKGYICAESELGKGSCFHIFLPVLESEQGEWAQKKNLQLVIGDENAKVLHLLEKDFGKLDYSVITCQTMTELRNCLKERKVDVLVCSQYLDGVSSIDFAMAVKEKYPGMIYIIMVSSVTREILDAKQRKIISGYIEKPVSVTMILEIIRSCMEVSE